MKTVLWDFCFNIDNIMENMNNDRNKIRLLFTKFIIYKIMLN